MNTTLRKALTATVGVAALSLPPMAAWTGVAGAAPIANSCGGVVVAGESTTIHDTYTVQKGDTLYQIVRDIYASRAAGPQPIATIARGARQLRTLNAKVVRNRGNLIRPGQVLRLPEDLRYCTKG